MDMNPAFINGTTEHLPNAEVTFDTLHAVKILNEAVGQVRRIEQKGPSGIEADAFHLAQKYD